MRFRKLKVAVTVLSLSASFFLAVLWAVSYWRLDGVVCHWIPHRYIMALSLCGELGVVYSDNNKTVPTGKLDWEGTPHYPYRRINNGPYPGLAGRLPPFNARFRWHHRKYHLYVGAPYWFLVTMAVALGVAPWMASPGRFSLRALLIAMALAALLLTGVLYSGVSLTSY